MNTENPTKILKRLTLLLVSIVLIGCGPSLEDKTYNLFYRFCKNIDLTQMNQVIQVFGESQFNSWCSCASHKTEDVIPIKKQFQILSKEVGMIDPDYQKFQFTAINSFGECIATFPASDDRTRNLIKNLSEYMKSKAVVEGGSYGLSKSNPKKEDSQAIYINEINTNKSYKELRNEILSSGWSVYKRNNEIKDWYKHRPYPELDYCMEDVCQASFINNDNTKVRKVIFGYCSPDGYVVCSNKPRGFELPQKDIVISKSDSDKEFLRIKQRIED